MEKAFKMSDAVLVHGKVYADSRNGTTEVEFSDGEVACVNTGDVLDVNGPKTITKESIWTPTVPLPWCPGDLMVIAGECYGVKRGGDNYLMFILARIPKDRDDWEWTTWKYNQSTDGLFDGHYFPERDFKTKGHAYAAALEDFNTRNYQ